MCVATLARAQGNFNSGSTGADGPFSPTASQAVQLPPGGVFNFTTISIPQNVEITFIRNARNTPVIMLATGNVTISGGINLNGGNGGTHGGGAGGPGGFNGGAGGFGVTALRSGITGDGPGGGLGGLSRGGGGGGFAAAGGDSNVRPSSQGGTGGPGYGTSALSPLIGGSGGGAEVDP